MPEAPVPDASEGSDPALASPALRSAPRLTVDVGPIMETQWTGIPVFTRRLIESLLREGSLDLSFSFNLTSIPRDRVVAAIKAGTGTFLRQEYEECAFSDFKAIDMKAPLLFPSVKRSFEIAQAEASVVHDISTLVMPENHEEANVAHHLDELKTELRTNTITFCVSEATRAALETYYPSCRNRTAVLYQYADWPGEFELLERNLPSLRLGRYAVVVGTIEPRKNLAILLRALSTPQLMRSDLKFVIIGKMGWLVETFLSELSPEQRSRLIFSGFVSELIKYRLIVGSDFMVFPSLYEGFGIPALEALSLGKPVLASRTSSFPEVIGEAGLYFDPLSADDFASAFSQIEHRATLKGLSSIAKSQSEKFNWRRMASPVVNWVGSH